MALKSSTDRAGALAPDEGLPHKLIESVWYLTELDQPTEAPIAEIVSRAAA